MEAQDIIALALAVAALAYLVRTLWRTVQGRAGCSCAHKKNGSQRGALNRLPLVTPESVGRPFSVNDDGPSPMRASGKEASDKQPPAASAADPKRAPHQLKEHNLVIGPARNPHKSAIGPER